MEKFKKKINSHFLIMRFLWVLVWSSILQVWGQAFGADPGTTYYGRMIDPNGNAVISSSVQFRLQIRTPGNENCLLYEEGQSKDLRKQMAFFLWHLAMERAAALIQQDLISIKFLEIKEPTLLRRVSARPERHGVKPHRWSKNPSLFQ
ncbi:MAG: hypothetical protein IPK04_09240 [Bdellovibrionales bacterium]|nr:hypothetical protein [Bdellovibrionales bacterium]